MTYLEHPSKIPDDMAAYIKSILAGQPLFISAYHEKLGRGGGKSISFERLEITVNREKSFQPSSRIYFIE